MKSWSKFTTFALAAALLASPAFAGNPGRGAQGDRTSLPNGPGEPPAEVMVPSTQTPERSSIEGKVTAIEHDSGQLVLATEEGLIALMAEPSELQGVKVGDMVRVSFVMDDDDDSSR